RGAFKIYPARKKARRGTLDGPSHSFVERGEGLALLARLQRLAKDVAERRTRIRGTILRNGLLLFRDLHRLDREVRLFRTIEASNHRVELLADLIAIGALFVAAAAEVGALDEAGRAIVACLHFKTVVTDFKDGDSDDVVLLQRARCGTGTDGGSALFKLLDAKADAFLLDVDVEHDNLNLLALAVEVQRFFARDAPGDVRHVNHAVDVAGQADEQAELGRILDFALDHAANRMRFCKGAPGV